MKTRRLKTRLRRFSKYLAGGSLYFWVGYGIFALMYSGFHWHWLPSKVVADVIGLSCNYAVQRYWTFADRMRLAELRHVSRYTFIEAIGFVLDYLIIGFLNRIGITPYVGFFISAGFFTVWSYLWYKYWVFPQHKGKAAGGR